MVYPLLTCEDSELIDLLFLIDLDGKIFLKSHRLILFKPN